MTRDPQDKAEYTQNKVGSMKILKACMIFSPVSGLLFNFIVNLTGGKNNGLIG